jgi:magnesium transporter
MTMSLTQRRRVRLHQPHARIGAPPGTLQAPDGALTPIAISAMAWNADELEERDALDLAELPALRQKFPVVWITVTGLGEVDRLNALGEILGFHKLALEDTLNVSQRPKLDEYEDHLYGVARLPFVGRVLQTQQVSLFLADGVLVTILERPTEALDGIRERIRNGRPALRGNGVDYLTYAVLDTMVDAYFPVLDAYAQELFDLEASVLDNPAKEQISRLYELKRDLVTLRRYVPPLRDLVEAMASPANSRLTTSTRTFMRDCMDHARQAVEIVESGAGHADSLIDLYMSLVNLRMNDVMKVLTVISTLFIPLSFIAGLYGMNFDPEVSGWNMPELGWRFGYPYAIGMMALCAVGMLTWFRRKGWLR